MNQLNSLKVGALNCRGIVDEKKRKDVFHWLRSKQLDICCLTETHGKNDLFEIQQWESQWGYKTFSSNCSDGRKKGVMILFNNTFSYTIHQSVSDPDGRYIILDLTIFDIRFLLVALYGPNKDVPDFFNSLLRQIVDVGNYSIIMCGDFNVVQNYDLDTTGYENQNNPNSQLAVFDMMNSLDLHDIFRDFHPESKTYSWHKAGTSLKQARLDYFLISTDLSSFVESTAIRPGYRTDHSLILTYFTFVKQNRGRGTWKFNNSLLYDPIYVGKVKQCIKRVTNQYQKMQNNVNNPESVELQIDDQLFFEMLKLEIRGMTIPYSVHKKRQRDKNEKQLENEIQILQDQLNLNPSQDTKDNLFVKKNELEKIREEKIQGIIIRTKARWAAYGEKNSKYFCNLEKRHHTEKIIPKLVLCDNTEIYKQEDIINETQVFYSNLYKRKKDSCSKTKFQDFTSNIENVSCKLNEVEKSICEGEITLREALEALKLMRNGKTPGMDGFTVEFYKYFWSDLGVFLVRSINYSYKILRMSSSQRRSMITLIPKSNRNRWFLKNWRPISLLGVDYKIASSVIANRIKKVLPKIISETQKGFIKGRKLAENTRFLFDLIETMDRKNMEGLLLLIDFEKAFDSLNWEFIDNSLSFFNFGSSLRQWIKIFYKDISSCILYNGHCSNYFDIERGVRQGDPLSPYLFIIAAEILSLKVKQSNSLRGIVINGKEFLLGQYADDTFFLLDGCDETLGSCLDLLDLFSSISGLQTNCDKSKAIWLGSKKGCGKILLPEAGLQWINNENWNVLGITFNIFMDDYGANLNYETKIEEIEKLLTSWSFRNLTLLGKIAVIKSLAIPKLVHLFQTLPNPTNAQLTKLNTQLYKFIWNNKPDKISRKIIIRDIPEGGLRMCHIPSFVKSLKIMWLKSLLNCNYESDWKSLINVILPSLSEKNFWSLNQKSLHSFSSKINNPFWKDVINAWGDYIGDPLELMEFLHQPLWNNNFIKIANKPVYWKRWVDAEIFYIYDILKNDGSFLSYTEFSQKFNVRSNFIDYFSIVSAIPKSWTKTFKETLKNDPTYLTNPSNLSKFLASKDDSKSVYNNFIKRIVMPTIKSAEKWEKVLALNEKIQWRKIYGLPFSCVKETKIQCFQYKLLHRILPSNKFLYQIRYMDNPNCSFCGNEDETLEHLFFQCQHVFGLWACYGV